MSPTHTHVCVCHHGHVSHRYQLATRTNVGECLAPNCWCTEYKEAVDGAH